MTPTADFIAEVKAIAAQRVAAGLCPRCGVDAPSITGICEECEHAEEANESYED